MRGILARKYIEKLRIEEMEFLGMSRKKKTVEEERNDPIKKMEETRKDRKMKQEANWKKYQDAKGILKEEINENQGVDIQEQMLKERREWVNDTKANTYKLPDDCKGFYERLNAETPLSPEEEAAKAAEEEEADKGKKGKKGGDKKEGKKGKKGKKGGGDDDAQIYKIGITEAVQKFDEIYEDFANDWGERDERDNYK